MFTIHYYTKSEPSDLFVAVCCWCLVWGWHLNYGMDDPASYALLCLLKFEDIDWFLGSSEEISHWCADLHSNLDALSVCPPIARSRHPNPKLQTPNVTRKYKSFWTNEQLEPRLEPLKSEHNNPWPSMAHDHLRWVRSAWQGKSTRPTGWVPKASWRKPSQSSRRCWKLKMWNPSTKMVQSCFLTNCTSSCLWDMDGYFCILQIW